MGTQGNCKSIEISMKSAESETESTSTLSLSVFGLFHLIVSLGLILAMGKFLKQAFVAAAIKFPSALFGMFCIFSVLMILDSIVPSAATALLNFFSPAFTFIQHEIRCWVGFREIYILERGGDRSCVSVESYRRVGDLE
ncbi:hypothetical protein SESBI_28188 [Sesbania bispinosa]|nr:hypothetical protein SESBI_28188 [Sesbania bispinosa]